MENGMTEQIEKRLGELPEDVRNAVLSVEWEQKVQTIATKNALHIDQTGALGDTTLMAMLGFFDMADFASHIAQELTLPAEKAATIAADITNEVFMPIRESLRTFTEKAKAAPPTVSVSTPSAPTPVPPAPVPTPAQPLVRSTPVVEAPKPDLSAADAMLQAKTVSLPAQANTPAAAPTIKTEAPPSTSSGQVKPANYSADPYREPPL